PVSIAVCKQAFGIADQKLGSKSLSLKRAVRSESLFGLIVCQLGLRKRQRKVLPLHAGIVRSQHGLNFTNQTLGCDSVLTGLRLDLGCLAFRRSGSNWLSPHIAAQEREDRKSTR